MFKILIQKKDDKAVNIMLTDRGLGHWLINHVDHNNYTYVFGGFDDEECVILVMNPVRSGWDAIVILQSPGRSMPSCRIGAPSLDEMTGQINQVLKGWEFTAP